MRTTLTYDEAVDKLSTIGERSKNKNINELNMFDMSVIIADIYEVDKHDVLDDLVMKRRENILHTKVMEREQ